MPFGCKRRGGEVVPRFPVMHFPSQTYPNLFQISHNAFWYNWSILGGGGGGGGSVQRGASLNSGSLLSRGLLYMSPPTCEETMWKHYFPHPLEWFRQYKDLLVFTLPQHNFKFLVVSENIFYFNSIFFYRKWDVLFLLYLTGISHGSCVTLFGSFLFTSLLCNQHQRIGDIAARCSRVLYVVW